jgi:hypothetical protein
VLLPQHKAIWKRITKISIKHGTHLTSHYFRSRYQNICNRLPIDPNTHRPVIPVNEWMLYMGSVQSGGIALTGHLGLTYRTDDYPGMLQRYETYLAPDVSLSGAYDHTHQPNADALQLPTIQQNTPAYNSGNAEQLRQIIREELERVFSTKTQPQTSNI